MTTLDTLTAVYHAKQTVRQEVEAEWVEGLRAWWEGTGEPDLHSAIKRLRQATRDEVDALAAMAKAQLPRVTSPTNTIKSVQRRTYMAPTLTLRKATKAG
jgi:hypothetical protein